MSLSSRTFQSAGKISQHYIPGAYSRIDSIKGQGGLVSANNGVIMGQSTGGKPATLLQFNTIAEAVNALKGGPLMEAVRLAFNPGNDLNPQRLFAMRVNTATQSTYDMEDGSANPMIQVDSRDYGLSQNQITLALAAGTVSGKKVTVGFKTDTEVFDNVIQNSIEITHATATVTIENSSGTTEMTLSVGPLTIDFDTYTNLGDLAAYINDQVGYSAVVEPGQEDASTKELDGVTTQSLTGGYTCESTMYAIINKLNNESGLVEASAVNAAIDITIPTNFTTIYMTGGGEGTYTGTEWTAALVVLEAEDVQFVSTPDPATTVHASIKTHCEAMSAVTGRKERQFLVGGTWADTLTTAITNAGNLNSKWGLMAFNGFTQYDVNGTIQNYDASYYACLLLGQKVASAINAPLTFNTMNIIELEDKLTDAELEQAIQNGICAINYNAQGIPVCVRQVNSYLTDDLKWNEFSMVSEMGFVGRDLRSYLEGLFVGRAGNALTNGVMRGAVENKLAQYTDLGIFTVDASGTAWWNVQITISGDVVYVDFDAYLTAPVNFIFTTNHFHELVTTL